MRKIILSGRTSSRLDKLLEYLELDWSLKVKNDFILKPDKSLRQIQQFFESRKKANFTQEQLAEKLNVKRTYISKIECASSEVRLSTLRKIVETGLGGKLHVTVEL